jgi:hypothetical protein
MPLLLVLMLLLILMLLLHSVCATPPARPALSGSSACRMLLLLLLLLLFAHIPSCYDMLSVCTAPPAPAALCFKVPERAQVKQPSEFPHPLHQQRQPVAMWAQPPPSLPGDPRAHGSAQPTCTSSTVRFKHVRKFNAPVKLLARTISACSLLPGGHSSGPDS